MEDASLFDLLGGRATLERVHKLFYDKVYAQPWLKEYFKGVEQKVVENQQTDFMTSNMGGGKIYSGGFPQPVHKHMHITGELFELRAVLLRDSILECGIPEDLAERWLKIDQAFRSSLVKSDPSQCEKRYATDEIINIPKPPGL
ncbi:MAG: group 1 truncated hemoglobin [Nitrospinae bacterium]|nr:group 1 truncated hemoglobin [Nitrospinota bacterium]